MQHYKIVLSFQTNMHQGPGIGSELVIILAFLVKDTLKRCDSDTGMPNANSTGRPLRGQIILHNSRHYLDDSLSFLHPLQSRQEECSQPWNIATEI